MTSSDLAGGAGSDLVPSKESSAGQATLDISATASSEDQWRVDVSRSDSVWPSGLDLDVRRSSNGSGAGSISGGTSYLSIGSSPATFFSGSGDRTSIGLQLRLTGLSVSIGPDTYSTTVTYTVVDL